MAARVAFTKDDTCASTSPDDPLASRPLLAAAATIAGLTAFGGSPATTEPPADGDAVVADAPIPEARCEANRDAGTVTYLTGFDFAATAGMIGVFVAEQRGYFDELCLDVEVTPSFSTANYPLVAGGEAQIASGGSFSEVAQLRRRQRCRPRHAHASRGGTPIDGLIVKPGTAATLEDLAGTTIGVKGKIPASVAAMLASVGLVENEDYTTVLLDGFDPVAHIALDDIVGFPGYKSNEPGTLDRAGIEYDLFDPIDYDIPGSFGVNFTSREFIDDHPTAAQDFVRASMRGLAEAIADPDGGFGAGDGPGHGRWQPELPVAGGRGVPLADRVGVARGRRTGTERRSASRRSTCSRPRSTRTPRSACSRPSRSGMGSPGWPTSSRSTSSPGSTTPTSRSSGPADRPPRDG